MPLIQWLLNLERSNKGNAIIQGDSTLNAVGDFTFNGPGTLTGALSYQAEYRASFATQDLLTASLAILKPFSGQLTKQDLLTGQIQKQKTLDFDLDTTTLLTGELNVKLLA